MSRTRGAGQIAEAFHQDDGELLDKEGKPIPTTREAALAHLAPQPEGHHVDAAKVEAEPLKPVEYICNQSTWSRDMDGYEALKLLEILAGAKMEAKVSAEELGKMPADVRRHFRRA